MATIELPDTPFATNLPSPEEMARYDRETIAAGTPASQLMERAGCVLFDYLSGRFEKSSPIVIFCGPGNNGGDGLVLSRLLVAAGFHKVRVIVALAQKYSEGFKEQLQAGLQAGLSPELFPDLTPSLPELSRKISHEAIIDALRDCDCLVDSLLGTGQRKAPAGAILTLTELARSVERKKVIAVDIPTGVNGDTGAVYTPSFSAGTTICIEQIKRGLLLTPAREQVGDLICRTIGIDCSMPSEMRLLNSRTVPALPERPIDLHKFKAGTVLVAGGSRDMPGAANLSALAALRSGAGLVRLLRLEGAPPPTAPEIILRHCSSGATFSATDIPAAIEELERAKCMVLGPGLGRSSDAAEFLIGVVSHCSAIKIPSVIDADALNIIAEEWKKGRRLDITQSILTPHEGEAARLLNCSVDEIRDDRLSAAKRIHSMCGSVVVLKGASTIIYGEGVAYLNVTGNPWMATAGSGDVLAGLIGALVAQGLNNLEAACLSVFKHGLSGNLASKKSGGPIIASDIIESLPATFSSGRQFSAA